MWRKYLGKKVDEYEVEGDLSVPNTHWWNHLWLMWFVWKTIVVFQPQTNKPYYVGYRDFRGMTMIRTKKMTDLCFRVRVGRESCHFFAVDIDGNEVELKETARTSKDNGFFLAVTQI